jgi:hypothetical protein
VATSEIKDLGEISKLMSRRSFLKIAGACGLVLGTRSLLHKPGAASAHESLTNNQAFTYVVYTRGPETFAQKYTGGVYPGGDITPLHSTRPDEVIQAILNDGGPLDDPDGTRAGPGHIYIRDGLYQLSASFSGFDLRSYTVLTLGPQAVIRVPSGYSGPVFRLQSKVGSRPLSNCTINGGIIHEANPPQRDWTGISLHAISSGVYFNKFRNTHILDAGTGIELKGTSNQLSSGDPNFKTGGGWVNGNSFESLTMLNNNVFIDFVMSGSGKPTSHSGINRNHFINIECQSGRHTMHGIRNIRDRGNTFIAVNIWDINLGGPTAIVSNVDEKATGTIIVSGEMTGQNFTDRGTSTKIIDELNSTIDID